MNPKGNQKRSKSQDEKQEPLRGEDIENLREMLTNIEDKCSVIQVNSNAQNGRCRALEKQISNFKSRKQFLFNYIHSVRALFPKK